MLNDWIPGLIRTYVPLAIGTALTFLFRTLDVVIDDQTGAAVTGLAVAVVTAVYYTVVKALESRYPALGRVLLALGLTAKTPTYAPPALAPSNDVTPRPYRAGR